MVEKLKDETEDAYLAFLSYLNADGVSLNAAWKIFSTDNGAFDEPMPDIWYVWASKYKWDDRLQELREQNIDVTEVVNPNDYNEKLKRYQTRQLKLNAELSKVTRLALQRLRARLVSLEAEEIPASAIPNYINALSRMVDLFTKSEAEQLALEELMLGLQELKDKDTENKVKPLLKPVNFDFNRIKEN